ncbi:Catalase [Vibrio crassostreae]|uniref:Catalase n=1 Tax=Vibrio crassostreae TaxID=246167 RepID=A0A822MNE5_9VIBR|nr:catalase [Vibrio crassostreae]TCN05625.1 catalase [Vibrio crassostreae]CAK2764780.1 Catalase [Vibrio crassostreae]CAK2840751.1 Catalase [Vibrio crassostreae]CAK3255632.1 Catalase [Vibrio crassostreae]CDT01130.1 Catalase [Vibrio crassostreae]
MSSKLTTASGCPVAHNNHSLTAGERGPMLLQDTWYLEKLSHFNREVIPERRMHAKGSGAYGTFKVTHDISEYSKAAIFSEIGKETELFARFTTVAGERGAADAERDIRGFALKFYTDQGNWDVVGNNTPVFFLADPLKFPDLNRVVKRDPETNMHSAESNWDFWTSLPEALHQVTYVMGDRGLPATYRHMHGFGSHTFSLINAKNERFWVKFHFKTQQGIKNLTDEEAERIVGKDRDSHQRDLFDSIKNGDFPRWKMFIQVMPEAEADSVDFNPFDLTRVWSHSDYPLIPVGEFELNKNPKNFFAEVEQSAFNPAAVVPGIGYSPDKMLQGRLFAYRDAQNYRLGVNHHQIPVNAPRCPVHSSHRDGLMRVDGNAGSTIGYEPNQYGEWAEQPDFSEPPLKISGNADHYYHRDGADSFEQAGDLFRLMTPEEQTRLFDNTARAMTGVSEEVKQRHIDNAYKADPAYGIGLKNVLGMGEK